MTALHARRRRWSVFLTALLLLAGCGGSSRPTATAGATRAAVGSRAAGLFGDLNGNGLIDAADATKVLRIVVGLDAAPSDLSGHDFNGNGAIDAADATKVLRVVVGLDPALSIAPRFLPTRLPTVDATHGAVRGSVQKRLKRGRQGTVDPSGTTAVWVTENGRSTYIAPDAQGNYSFGRLDPSQPVTITAAAPGYGHAPITVGLTANAVTDVATLFLSADNTDSSGAVAGFVYDASGAPVSRAVVSLGDQQRLAATDENGYYVFGLVAPGTYQTSCVVGSNWRFASVTVNPFQTAVQDFRYGAALARPVVTPMVTPTNVVATGTCFLEGFAQAAGSATIASYQWDFGDGNVSAPDPLPYFNHAYAQAGTYRATLTATDSLGVTGTGWVQVNVAAGSLTVTLSPANAATNADWMLDGDTATLHASGETVLLWQPGQHTITGTALANYYTPSTNVTAVPNDKLTLQYQPMLARSR